jgi:Zn-dependent metalloprotease
MKRLGTTFSLLITLISVFSFSANAQNSRQEELDRLLKEASEEINNAMKCDNLIKSLDKELENYKSNPEVYNILKIEIEKQKVEIRKNCVNGVYNPDANIPVEEKTEEEFDKELVNNKLEELKNKYAEEQQKVPETYNETYYPFTRIPKSISFYLEATVTKATFASWMKEKYNVQLEATSDISFNQMLDKIKLLGYTYHLLLRPDGSIKKAYGTLHNAQRANSGKIMTYQQALSSSKSIIKDIEPHDDTTLIYVQKNYNIKDSAFYLCYTIIDDQFYYYIDAVNGDIIHKKLYKLNCFKEETSHEMHVEEDSSSKKDNCTLIMGEKANNPEMVKTYYYGIQKIETHHEQKTLFNLKSNRNQNIIKIVDSLGVKNPSGKDIISTNNKWLCYDTKSGLIDAYIAGEKTMEFYSTKLKRNSFDGKGSQLNIYFRPFEKDGTIFRNAYWSDTRQIIAFGIMNGHPLSSIDVIAHEITHGLIYSFCPSMNYHAESGALNEGISDILGLATERFANMPVGNFWKILDMQKGGKGRSIADPKSLEYPDTYKGNYWLDVDYCITNKTENDYCGVHTNSTIIGHWFYLLSNAKKGTNDNEKPFDVDGSLSYDQATQLVYESIQFLTPNMTFKEYSEITILLAEDKFGKTSSQACTVKSAWYAVGVLLDAPSKCVPGWSFTISDQQYTRSNFYGKGDSIVITSIDKETGYRTKLYRNKENAYWKAVVETEDGIVRKTIPNDYANKMLSSKNLERNLEMQNMVFEQMIKEEKEKLKDPTLTPEQRAQITETIIQGEKIYRMSKTEGEKTIQEIKENENADGYIGLELVTEDFFWNSIDSIKKFDAENLKDNIIYEGLKAKVYQTKSIGWTSTTEIPYGIGDFNFMLPGIQGDKKLGVDHMLRGFPLIINGEKVAWNIKQFVPDNFEILFSDAAVF